MSFCCNAADTKRPTELTSLLDLPVVKKRNKRSGPCAVLCLPVTIIIVFSVSCIVLSTEVRRLPCTITCTHRPNCSAQIGNRTYETHQGSCSWREQVAQCTCYKADGVVTVNPFILLSPLWTLLAVLSGGALALFALGLLCWCCTH
jgi:hypothetical protein